MQLFLLIRLLFEWEENATLDSILKAKQIVALGNRFPSKNVDIHAENCIFFNSILSILISFSLSFQSCRKLISHYRLRMKIENITQNVIN